MANYYRGDVGTIIELDTGENLTGYTTLEIKYQQPDGTEGAWAGTHYDTTKIRYTTLAAMQGGPWRVQAYAVLPDGTWYGDTAFFQVRSEFE